jgi:hypothetical protein
MGRTLPPNLNPQARRKKRRGATVMNNQVQVICMNLFCQQWGNKGRDEGEREDY